MLMRYLVLLILAILPLNAEFKLDINNLDLKENIWQVPDDTKYNEWATLCAHNSYSSEAYGYWPYAQQSLSVSNQIKMGVYTLMLDTHTFITKSKKDIGLCHKSCELTAIFRAAKNKLSTAKDLVTLSTPTPKMFKDCLDEIRLCLEEDKNIIITLILEDYVNDPVLFDKVFSDSGIAPYILKKSDWEPMSNGGWPTLKWLRQKGKRVIIFIDSAQSAQSDYIRSEWNAGNIAENSFSTIEIIGNKNIIAERPSSQKEGNSADRYLYLFNFFSEFPIPLSKETASSAKKFISEFKKRKDYAKLNGKYLIEALNYASSVGLGNNKNLIGRWPNFIALDYVQEGAGIAIVNAINHEFAQAKDASMFAKIKAYN